MILQAVIWVQTVQTYRTNRSSEMFLPFSRKILDSPNWTSTFLISTGWWLNHPFQKYARQNGSFPQIGVKIKNIWNHHPVKVFFFSSFLFRGYLLYDDFFFKRYSWGHPSSVINVFPCYVLRESGLYFWPYTFQTWASREKTGAPSCLGDTVDGSELLLTKPIEVGSLSTYLQGFTNIQTVRISRQISLKKPSVQYNGWNFLLPNSLAAASWRGLLGGSSQLVSS